jgi:phospholipid/cholesterol/gamma-HCH transport system substrate-binding protein
MASKDNPQARERRVAVRAGLFVAIGLSIAAIVIFLLGKERNLFEKRVSYTGAFENVDGLSIDAPVRLGGLQVGHVSTINFETELADKRIVVTMEINAKYKERVRRDSVARVASRGVLGDKAIDISLGSPEAEMVPAGGEIATGSSGDISSLLKASGEIVDNAVAITRDLRGAVAAYTDPELRKDVGGLIKSARNVVGMVETGRGAVHYLIYDKQSTEDVHQLLATAVETAQRLDGAITNAEAILAEVKSGNGSAHALIYDQRLANALTEVGKAAEEISTLVHDAKKSPNGAINQLVYGDARGMFNDLGQAAADVRAVTGKIRSGEGSLGAIINDPTVYEDLKEVLGNVKRNRVLRELVRYSISNNENLGDVGKPQEKKK